MSYPSDMRFGLEEHALKDVFVFLVFPNQLTCVVFFCYGVNPCIRIELYLDGPCL